jgi:putative SOS response-associated peptidase YedK
MRWGLIPFWAGPGAFNRLTFNARAEELSQKPTFRDALKSRRCLVPADVFYEWRRSEKQKQPFAIAFTNQRPLHLPDYGINGKPKMALPSKASQSQRRSQIQ